MGALSPQGPAERGGVRRTSVLQSKTLAQGGIHFRRAGEIKFWGPRGACSVGVDNAAMIGCQGYYEYLAGNTAGWELNAKASLDISKG